MYIQLIQAPRNAGYSPNSRTACYAPIGLISIATYCREKFPAANIEVLDGELMLLSEIVNQLQPGSFVGIETKLHNYSSALAIAEAAKRIGCAVILGGVYASSIFDAILQNRSALIDYIIVGYGELAFVDVINGELGLRKKQPRIVFHPHPDFDVLPLPDRRTFIDLQVYIGNFKDKHPNWSRHTATNIITLQGCTNKCVFCARQTPGIGVIYWRNPKSIWKEVQILNYEYGVDYVVAFDDQIATDYEWLSEVAQSKPSGMAEVIWHVFSNAENITSQSLAFFQKLPVRHVFIGIETGDSGLARTVGKGNGFSPKRCLEAVRLLAGAGIQITPSFVLGLPGETVSTLQRTLDFAERIRGIAPFEEVFAACLIPFPGSPAFRMLVSKCIDLKDQDVLDGEKLTTMWFKQFCDVEYKQAREFCERILSLAPYRITLDKGENQ